MGKMLKIDVFCEDDADSGLYDGFCRCFDFEQPFELKDLHKIDTEIGGTGHGHISGSFKFAGRRHSIAKSLMAGNYVLLIADLDGKGRKKSMTLEKSLNKTEMSPMTNCGVSLSLARMTNRNL